MALGISKPSVAMAGVIWVDVLRPQTMSSSFLVGKPVSLIVVLVLCVSLLLGWKRWSAPVKKANLVLLPIFMGWITLTTTEALFPHYAWWKYDIAVKTIFIAILVSLVLNSRHKMETAIWIFVISVGFFCTQAGLKTLIGGGGYGVHLLNASSGGITESSTLSAAAIMALPLIFYLIKHGLLVKEFPLLRLVLYWFIAASLLTMVGTYARTGLVCLAAFIGLNAVASKDKWKYVLGGLCVAAGLAAFTSDEWATRMSTVTTATQENSALGRIVVWRWTIDFVKDKPLGGGFQAYLANRYNLVDYIQGDEFLDRVTDPRAFHSIIFEVLGEHGYIGLFIFCTILSYGMWCNYLSQRQGRRSGELWREDMAIALARALIVICIGGLFIAIAFYPMIWFLVAFAVSLHNVPFTAETGQRESTSGEPLARELRPARTSIYWQYRGFPPPAKPPDVR